MLLWRNYNIQGHSCQRIKIATVVYFRVVQKLLTNLNVLALHYGGSFFLFVFPEMVSFLISGPLSLLKVW